MNIRRFLHERRKRELNHLVTPTYRNPKLAMVGLGKGSQAKRHAKRAREVFGGSGRTAAPNKNTDVYFTHKS